MRNLFNAVVRRVIVSLIRLGFVSPEAMMRMMQWSWLFSDLHPLSRVAVKNLMLTASVIEARTRKRR